MQIITVFYFPIKLKMMKTKIKYLALIILLYACGEKKTPLSKVKEYNQELKQFAVDSTKTLDTVSINKQFDKTGMTSIMMKSLEEVSDEASFKELLGTEKELLSRWEEIKGFKSYFGVKPDTLIRGCSSFDRAPYSTVRIPSAQGMRAISLAYYKVEVPIAFHIIKNRVGAGVLANMLGKINDQVRALNTAYNRFNISFKLSSIDSTVNDTWFDKASYYTDPTILQQMTSRLSINPSRIMNVFTLGSQKVIGESSFPWYETTGTSMDYIVINYNSLPGGPSTYYDGRYNEGKTLIHETGHFLGLFHTFEGGSPYCDSDANDGCNIGDQVDDTPSQKTCYFTGCDESANSCPAPGNDPVKNFMGYNPDACMSEMTEGQGERLLQCIIKFRYYLITNPA